MIVVAGIDSSTQSTKVILRNAETGAFLGQGTAPHSPTYPPVSEQDPHDWWTALVQAMAAARLDAGVDASEIRAVSVAAQCHGLVALDVDGTVIRKAKLWNDTTSSPEADELVASIGATHWVDRVHSLPTAAFTVSKILWLSRHEPDAFARMAMVLLPHDWLTFRLTGRFVTDRSEASGTGYFDATRGEYDLDVLRLIDPDRDWAAHVPTVLAPAEAAGVILTDIAAELGVSPAAIVGAGSGDQHAGALGLGARPGDTVFVLGTSGVVYTVSADPVADHTGIVDGVADAAGGYLPLICTLNAAKVTDAMVRLLNTDHAGLDELAQAAPRTPDRPVFAAFLDGERTPNLPHARGVISGLAAGLSREQFALAAYEGVVFGLVRGMQAISALGVPHGGRLIAIGGGSASTAYLQVIADTTGRTVLVAEGPDVVAAGAAVQAAAVLHGRSIPHQRDLWAPQTVVAAEPRHDPSLDGVWQRYLDTAGWQH